MKFTPLHLHSHFSLLDGLSQIDQITKRCKELGYTSCALTDHGNISGAVEFYKQCKKDGIKPILGCEMYISRMDATIKNENNAQDNMDHLVVLAKNKTGWSNLIKAVSRSNDDDTYYYKPRLDLNLLGNYSDGLICFSGHPGSELASCLFNGRQPKTYLEATQKLKSDYFDCAVDVVKKYKKIFGDNFFIEIQLVDNNNMSSKNLVAEILRKVGNYTNTICIATGDSHYINQEDNYDQMVILCSSLNTTLPKVNSLIRTGQTVPMSGFFKSNEYHIPDLNFMLARHKDFTNEVVNTEYLSSLVEDYDILRKPELPSFDCPNNLSELEYLKNLCDEGFKNRLKIKLEETTKYKDRLNHELGVFSTANLEGYFLIVQDYVNWAKSQGYLIGPGRGSGAGCLSSYLLNITGVNPIPYNLLFERFYNAGRNTKDNISYPDIDVDFPTEAREPVIKYIKDKYGKNNVCQLITFGRLQGKSAIKEVLRVHQACDNETANEISKCIPGEAEISDKLEEANEKSILRWTLENTPKELEKWVRMKDDGTLDGEMAIYFNQAIRIEGTYKSSGKHAAGVVISKHNLNEVCPMVKDKNKEEKIAGWEMSDLESVGHVKFDILGVSALSKLQKVRKLLRGEL